MSHIHALHFTEMLTFQCEVKKIRQARCTITNCESPSVNIQHRVNGNMLWRLDGCAFHSDYVHSLITRAIRYVWNPEYDFHPYGFEFSVLTCSKSYGKIWRQDCAITVIDSGITNVSIFLSMWGRFCSLVNGQDPIQALEMSPLCSWCSTRIPVSILSIAGNYLCSQLMARAPCPGCLLKILLTTRAVRARTAYQTLASPAAR